MEVIEMKGKVIIWTLLALSLAIIIVVAAIAPTVAKHKSDGSIVTYSYGGSVTLQLPQGVPPHPTTLMIHASHIEKQGDAPLRGPADTFLVYLWIPTLNRFVPVAEISDNPDPAGHTLIREVLLGTAVWRPGLMENSFIAEDEDIEIRMRGDVLLVNLTKGVHVSLPFQLLPAPMNALGDLSFDLPPIALEFRGFDSTYKEESTQYLNPAQGLSGWTIAGTSIYKPAWVRTWIQQWTEGTGDPFKFAGTIALHSTATYIPPPP
jgi:hypothetical protein